MDKDADVVGVVHKNRDEMDAAGIERIMQDRDELLSCPDQRPPRTVRLGVPDEVGVAECEAEVGEPPLDALVLERGNKHVHPLGVAVRGRVVNRVDDVRGR